MERRALPWPALLAPPHPRACASLRFGIAVISLGGCAERLGLEDLCQGAAGSAAVRADRSRTSARSAVALFGHSGNTGYFCSGVVIAPQTVLTAAHCVRGRADWAFEIYLAADLPSKEPWIGVRSWTEHPTSDLAALTLDGNVPIEPPRWSGDLPQARHRDRATLTGYGGPRGDVSRCLRVSEPVSDLGLDPQDATSGRLVGLAKGNTYPGDSGGPLIVDDEDGPILLGILSRVTGWNTSYGSLCMSARLRADDPWILQALPTPPVRLP